MKASLIVNGRIFDPGQGIDEVGDVLLVDGHVAGLGRRLVTQSDAEVFDASGKVVCPGFIDLHCHLREPGFEQKETISTGTRAAARGGFTTICCMPNTSPAIDSLSTVALIQRKAAADGAARVVPVAAVTRGRLGKHLTLMASLAEKGILGFSDDGDPVRDEKMIRGALLQTKKLGLPVIDHCEDPVGGPPAGEVRIVARDLRLAEETGGWVHIAHVSAAESAGEIRKAKARGVRVTAEVTPHHLTLTDVETQGSKNTMAKVNPPLRTDFDRRAMVAALKEGTIDVIATDHAPHTLADKQKDFAAAASGISSFETAFGSLFGLVISNELTLAELIQRLTADPGAYPGRSFWQDRFSRHRFVGGHLHTGSGMSVDCLPGNVYF